MFVLVISWLVGWLDVLVRSTEFGVTFHLQSNSTCKELFTSLITSSIDLWFHCDCVTRMCECLLMVNANFKFYFRDEFVTGIWIGVNKIFYFSDARCIYALCCRVVRYDLLSFIPSKAANRYTCSRHRRVHKSILCLMHKNT